eukprot:3428923-Amphidinium_carterae.1
MQGMKRPVLEVSMPSFRSSVPHSHFGISIVANSTSAKVSERCYSFRPRQACNPESRSWEQRLPAGRPAGG